MQVPNSETVPPCGKQSQAVTATSPQYTSYTYTIFNKLGNLNKKKKKYYES